MLRASAPSSATSTRLPSRLNHSAMMVRRSGSSSTSNIVASFRCIFGLLENGEEEEKSKCDCLVRTGSALLHVHQQWLWTGSAPVRSLYRPALWGKNAPLIRPVSLGASHGPAPTTSTLLFFFCCSIGPPPRARP